MRETNPPSIFQVWGTQNVPFRCSAILRGAYVEIVRGGGGDAQGIGLYEGCMSNPTEFATDAKWLRGECVWGGHNTPRLCSGSFFLV